MGPNFWEPGGSDPIHKCDERVSNTCSDETDGCCGVIPCTYCIEWNPETGSTVHATADFATNSWAATIAGAAWLGFWERNYETGECEFVVTLDGTEIYRKSCYDGQSCRDSSDSAGATIGEVSGVISWTKYEKRPLQYVQDEETNCTVHFCDDCECSVECLCVTITEPDTTETKGEICDTAYDCEPPLWAGTVGAFELSIALGRDEYGRCIITGTVGEEEAEPVLFPGCADASATITLADETTILLRAKKCSCDETDITIPCCDEIPITAESLNARIEGDSGFGPEGQFADCTWEGVLPLYTVGGPYFRTWAGIIPLTVNGGCTDCCDDVVFFVHISCDGTSERKLCFHYWYANTEAGYTLTPLDEGNTGWNPGTGNTEGDAPGYCAPLVEFEDLDGEPTTETVYASCSPLMFHHEDSGVAVLSASELALP